MDLVAYIPKGKVTTYKELARATGAPQACRAIGNALHKNPWSPDIPCHRVVKTNGEVGEFAGGKEKKKKWLKEEGVVLQSDQVVNLAQLMYRYT
mgnify:FL=1